MTDRPPSLDELSTEVVEVLNASSPDRLRAVAQYVEALAEHREREERASEADKDPEQPEERSENLPDDVPSKASVTVKTINDNRYAYWQWREGEQIKSKYKGPVSPDE